MTFNPQQIIEYVFYLVLLVVSFLAEKYMLAPNGTFVAVLALVTGHFFGNSVQLSQQVGQLSTSVGTLSNQLEAHIQAGSHATTTTS